MPSHCQDPQQSTMSINLRMLQALTLWMMMSTLAPKHAREKYTFICFVELFSPAFEVYSQLQCPSATHTMMQHERNASPCTSSGPKPISSVSRHSTVTTCHSAGSRVQPKSSGTLAETPAGHKRQPQKCHAEADAPRSDNTTDSLPPRKMAQGCAQLMRK
jgi:hypothetical protein